MFYKRLPNKEVIDLLCFRRCRIKEGQRGFCGVRENRGGKLFSLTYSQPCAVHVDPIEKEPSLHMLPGSSILCLASAGCNFRCKFCHNWHISTALPEETSRYYLPPLKVIELAKQRECQTISFTYTEPTIFYEYILDVFKLAKREGVKTLFHSNGSMEEKPLEHLLKYTNAVTIDLKAFNQRFYTKMSTADLGHVLKTLKIIKQSGVWLEIVNLVIPTQNDNPEDIRKMCIWIRDNLGKDIPLHFSRFHPAYKLINLPSTPLKTLEEAKRIANKVGLNYVTIGNVPGHPANSTYCPKCKKAIIKRVHFAVLENNIREGRCKFCGEKIPGRWK